MGTGEWISTGCISGHLKDDDHDQEMSCYQPPVLVTARVRYFKHRFMLYWRPSGVPILGYSEGLQYSINLCLKYLTRAVTTTGGCHEHHHHQDDHLMDVLRCCPVDIHSSVPMYLLQVGTIWGLGVDIHGTPSQDISWMMILMMISTSTGPYR